MLQCPASILLPRSSLPTAPVDERHEREIHVFPTDSEKHVSFAGELIISDDHVPLQAVVSSVYDRFSGDPLLEALAVVDEMKPVGLITRTKLLFTLSRRFGYELHARHPIVTIADVAPLIVSAEEPLETVIDKAFARHPKDIYDEIVVTGYDGNYLGLLSVKQLVMQQSSALSLNVLQKEIATARAQELEMINQVKSQFLANVTHELRSPVNAIVGLAELLKIAAGKGEIAQVQERISFMVSMAGNLRGVINNILDLSKIEAGKMEVRYQVVDVVSLLSEIAETTRILIGDKPVTVDLVVLSEPVNIITDPVKLRQIVMNLASNAAKFTDKGSIVISADNREGNLWVEVSDTGIGIRAEDLHLLFTAFGQIEDPAVKTREGTGLGLAISKNLARLIGGTISVSSVLGQGTQFRVSLPVQNQ